MNNNEQLSILSDINADGHETLMRWGPYKGTKMRDLPKNYLTKLYNSKTIGGELRNYLDKNYLLLMHKP